MNHIELSQVLFQSDVELLAVEAETAFGHGGCFERRPWLQHFEATEREKVVRQLGRPIYKACERKRPKTKKLFKKCVLYDT